MHMLNWNELGMGSSLKSFIDTPRQTIHGHDQLCESPFGCWRDKFTDPWKAPRRRYGHLLRYISLGEIGQILALSQSYHYTLDHVSEARNN